MGNDKKYKVFPNEEKSNITEIFIKLLDTNKVANNLLGLFLNFLTNCKLLFLELKDFFKSVLLREKNANSDPEIKAENIIKTIIKTNLSISSKSYSKKNKIFN